MSNHKMRTRIVSTIAALTLCPTLALAQAGSSPGPDDDPSQGSSTTQGSPSQGTAPSQAPGAQQAPSASPEGSSPSMMGTAPSGTASAPMGAAPSIDPSQIQKVFGTDATLIDLKSLNTEDVRQLQQTLQQRGHYKGEVDGIVGPQTRAALRAVLAEQFALNQRLINQGQLTEQLASSIGIDAQGVSPVRGVDMDPMGTPSQPGQRPSGSPSTAPTPEGTATPPDPTGTSPKSGSVTPTTPPAVEEEE